MKCPIRSEHDMIEVAPSLWQCAHCGYGPNHSGYHPFWALSSIEEGDGVIDAVCVRFDQKLDCYVMSGVSWEVDSRGAKVPLSFEENGSAVLSTEVELEESPLPIIIRAKGKWEFPPDKPKLRKGMFPSPLGLKEISLVRARG